MSAEPSQSSLPDTPQACRLLPTVPGGSPTPSDQTDEFLLHPFDEYKIIAVDGLDREVVQMVIAHLESHLHYNTRSEVQVFEELPAPPNHSSDEYLYFLATHEIWDTIWKAITRVPAQRPASAAEELTSPRNYIVPFSPLMATTRAAARIPWSAPNNIDRYRWLAGHWAGLPRPDITISIHNTDDLIQYRDVPYLQDVGTFTSIVIKGRGGINVNQLGRVLMQVMAWVSMDLNHG